MTAALKRGIRVGLPVKPDAAPEVLLELRGVRARAIDAGRFLSRVKALNGLLHGFLTGLGEGEEARALRCLFAVHAEDRGTTLTHRRRRAAGILGYNDTHFRKHIEPRLLRDFAWLLHEDSQTYTPRSRKAPPKIEISGDTPTLTPGEVNEHEELVSRIWALVYELRAELICKARLEAEGDQTAQAEVDDASGTSLWLVARLLSRMHDYLDRYGERILHGEAEFNAEGLIRLAGWSYELSPEQAKHLRYILAKSGGDRASFISEARAYLRGAPTESSEVDK
ncbi:hypothetical protein [Gaiella occulta]|uniref:hypothetical protein n=1 Tax=Gaiella occulta TaxID=1002870 RepID=UPI0011C04F3E|nr:hypothetical protein [Gaiella occulta]